MLSNLCSAQLIQGGHGIITREEKGNARKADPHFYRCLPVDPTVGSEQLENKMSHNQHSCLFKNMELSRYAHLRVHLFPRPLGRCNHRQADPTSHNAAPGGTTGQKDLLGRSHHNGTERPLAHQSSSQFLIQGIQHSYTSDIS